MQATKDVTSFIPFHCFIVLGDLYMLLHEPKYPDRDQTFSSAKGHKNTLYTTTWHRTGERTNSRS